MRSENFEITWDEREELDEEDAGFVAEYVAESSVFEQAIFKLSFLYECAWYMVVGSYRLRFYYRPDLTSAFFKLPEMLYHILTDKPGKYFLYFFGQGTDLNIVSENHGRYVGLSFHKYDQSRFDRIPKGVVLISKNQYCREWMKFIRKILGEIVHDNPEILTEKSYREYLDLIGEVEVLVGRRQ